MILKLLTNVSIAYIYKKAKFSSETISQTHLAENLEVLDEKKDWYKIQQEDGYKGWIAKTFVVEKPVSWDDHTFVYPCNQITWIYKQPDSESTTLRNITILSGVPALQFQGEWVKIQLPDGTTGWLEDNACIRAKTMDVDELIKTAFDYMGIPYFWGGKSPKGFDCSGFVQTCFSLNGVQLPRDAYQQAKVGEQISDDYKQWKAGDLIFFSEQPEKISHVAISLGNGDFIHASGFVRLNSLNPEHTDLYSEKYAKIFTQTMRVI